MYYSVFCYVWWLCKAINISVQYNERWASPRDYTVDPRLLPSGNPFKYYIEVLSLQSMKQHIITTMFDDVLRCFCFVFAC